MFLPGGRYLSKMRIATIILFAVTVVGQALGWWGPIPEAYR